MATMESLAADVKAKALLYLNESGEKVDEFPTSIVDFVLEFAARICHFPKHYTDGDIANALSDYKNVLAMSCQEVYNRAGQESEISHTEGSISTTYDSSWISGRLLSVLPNFVNTPGSLRK